MARGNLAIEEYVPVVRNNEGIYTEYDIATTDNLSVGGNVTVTGTSTFTGAATFTAAPVFSGGATQPVTINALVGATVVLTAAMSGGLFINRSTSGTPSWTLPTAAAGLWYDFLVSSTTAGFTVTGGTIFAKANPNGASVTGTTLTNTQATAVIGDFIRLVCDGTSWRGTAQTGIFAAA